MKLEREDEIEKSSLAAGLNAVMQHGYAPMFTEDVNVDRRKDRRYYEKKVGPF